MNLTWNRDGLLTMDFGSKRPLFDIKPELNKNRKAEQFPMAPEFYAMLMETPEAERRGYVFDPKRKRETSFATGRMHATRVSELISEFGRQAGIKTVDRENGPRFASAHDLRRSFAFRWAKRVMPPILQKMMRHADISTTMEFYVIQDENQTADAVWDAVGSALEHAKSHALA